MRHALINKETKQVVNVIIWEGEPWTPPTNHFVVQSDTAGIGDIWDESNNLFIRNNDHKVLQ